METPEFPGRNKPSFEFIRLNKLYEQDVKKISAMVTTKQARQSWCGKWRSCFKRKDGSAENKTEEKSSRNVYVIDFNAEQITNDLKAFRHAVSIILAVARPEHDSVLVNITSPVDMCGTMVWQVHSWHGYVQKIEVIACVDAVAASGGYMLAAVANTCSGTLCDDWFDWCSAGDTEFS